ncbi:MAG: PAS domain-containing protein [Hymenobacter sp.]|nr:MAG: PAS domain-containing protein [Hymenobacter sp.]
MASYFIFCFTTMSAISSDLLPVFNVLPGACLLLSPELIIEAASEAYLAVTFTQRKDLVDKYVFAVFPDNPNSATADARRTVQASLDQVLATGQPHELTLQPYDLPDPKQAGHFLARYWRTRNVPVLDAQGRVAHIIHEVTDITEQVQASTELRESQVREQTAHAQAEHQRGELQRIFEQAPVAIAVYRGPQFIIELANPTVCRLWGRTQEQVLGKGLFEALPEVAGMGFEELLNDVMATGKPYVANAMEAQHDRNGQRETVYWDFVYVPMYEDNGSIYGAMVVATEVTEQVQARQKIQELNDQLEAANQALHISNGELLSNQEEVLQVQQLLENSVTERTQQLEIALAEAQQQRTNAATQQRLLNQILGQVPASIATLSGPEHRYSFFNEQYQALSGDRTQLGQTVAEVFPEVVAQGFVGLLDQVYTTGTPFQGRETPAQLYDPATGQPEQRYVDFIFQPLLNEPGDTQGVLAFILDVTDKVRTRQQAEALQAQLAAAKQS